MDIIENIETDLGFGTSTPATDSVCVPDVVVPLPQPDAPAPEDVAPTPDPALVAAIHAVAPAVDADAWAAALTGPLSTYGISATPRRLAAFLGQVAEETGFVHLQENLHYSASRMCAVWPREFPTLAAAAPYAMNPEKLAAHIYANRLGDGNEASDDGWRFRGEGLIQLTGRALFTLFGATVGKTAEEAAVWCATIPGAAASACWYWTVERKLNSYADAWEITEITRLVNGGLTNLATRVSLSNAALASLKAGSATS